MIKKNKTQSIITPLSVVIMTVMVEGTEMVVAVDQDQTVEGMGQRNAAAIKGVTADVIVIAMMMTIVAFHQVASQEVTMATVTILKSYCSIWKTNYSTSKMTINFWTNISSCRS